MKVNKLKIKKLFIRVLFAFLLVFASFLSYFLVSGKITFGSLEEGWDGVLVATSFKAGNGTAENPYVISDASEYMYFKELIEGDSFLAYQDKYYVLDNDIDFNDREITPLGVVLEDQERVFKGHLDAKGYSFKNFLIKKPQKIGDTNYYGMFSKTVDAYFDNIVIANYSIIPDETLEKVVIGGLVGISDNTKEEKEEELESSEVVEKTYSSEFKNITISNFHINTASISSSENVISALLGSCGDGVFVKNVSLIGVITDNNKNNNVSIISNNLGKVENVVSEIVVNNNENNNILDERITNQYILSEGVITKGDEKVSFDDLKTIFNEELVDLYWDYVDNQFILKKVIVEEEKEVVVQSSPISKSFSFSIMRSPALSIHASGLENGTVYVNDLDADYYYYMGLNYTNSNNGSMPSGANQNIYSDANLAKVYIAYKGTEITEGSTLTGYVSLSDRYSDYVYYKYYPIVNGYVTIPLIDNPYAARPNDRAFNGWVTDYEGAVVRLDMDTYTRYVTVPAQSEISITMYASWTEASSVVASVNNSGYLDDTGLKDVGMYPTTIRTPIFDPDVYIPNVYRRDTIESGTSYYGVTYPSGAVNDRGNSLNNQACTPIRRQGRYYSQTCTYYMRVDLDEVDFSNTYYYIYNRYMTVYNFPTPIGYNTNSFLNNGDNIAGYFRKRNLSNGQSYAGMYTDKGVYQNSGTCSGSCTYYELVQYNETDVFNEDTNYEFYYLATRDTNIAYLTSDIDGFTNNVPVTVTGLNNGSNRSNYSIDLSSASVNAGDDLRIEYCNLYTGSIQPSSSGASSSYYNYVYGNFYNLKIGRGIPISTGTYNAGSWWNPDYVEGTYFNARGVVGGNDGGTGSSYNPTRYSFVVESGYYNYISGVSTNGSSSYYYVDGNATYGNDFDRVGNDNDSLGVYYNATSSYGGSIYGANNATKYITTTIKSGSYGDDDTDTAAGIYVGGLNGGTINSPAEIVVEGGKILYINGGPLISTNLTNYNAIYINIKGGETDAVFGGAAVTETHGNRLINAAGGVVNYGIFGGSNGFNGSNSSNSKGTLNGSTLVRVGGNCQVGGKSDTRFGIESGSVFGAGNGNSNYSQIGSVNNSIVIIEDNANIMKNVYGGGNYGAVVAQSGNSSSTNISINGGSVKGSVYGGGNNNGSGSTGVTSTINISVNSGEVVGSVYGGSCAKGIVYGSTNVVVNGGTVKTDVYGGGEGGFTDDNSPGTYVRDNVNVTINDGNVNGSVYGGSAFGTVNSINESTTTSNATTTVTVNGGVVTNSVFGGGKGGDKSPKVVGDITVNVNGGSIGKVFGGFDASGKPSNGDVVYLNGGTIGNAFGGGNNANQDRTDIRLQGATITGNLYGGSNLLGTVSESNVLVTSGSVTEVYGGNNLDGLTNNTNVTVTGNGAVIAQDIYGGGNEAESGITNVNVTNRSVHSVYGGGKKAGASDTHVTLTGVTGEKVFGGSNVSGTVGESNVLIENSTVTKGYGGNNQGGQTTTTNITAIKSTITDLFGGGDNAESGTSNVGVNGGNITNVFGGGNEAGVNTTNVNIGNGNIINVYGGSNNSGDITTSNVTLGSANLGVTVNYNKRAPGYYPQSNKPTYAEINVTVTNLTIETIQDWEISLNVPGSQIFANNSQSNITLENGVATVNSVNRYYGYNSLSPGGSYSFSFSVLSDTDLNSFDVTGEPIRPIDEYVPDVHVTNVYGGNNRGGVTSTANINAIGGVVGTMYGGGNLATVGNTNVETHKLICNDLYGGGNAAGVTGNTVVDINGSTINNNLYGGGNEGTVSGNTEVFVTDAHILGNAFAGGNGSTAVVRGNSTITIDGSTEVGTASTVAPDAGCVFGSGNAASTGVSGVDNSVATVNLVGGIIHGNVYGGPKMAVVYGVTHTNIGTSAVNNNDLVEDDIKITGTVFGGGESNASGSETYDWTFISVTKGIDVTINGAGYIANDHDFIINGSIFGSGNASSSAGDSNILVKDLGTLEKPNKSISIQRATNLVIDHSVIELEGTTDRTNEYSDIKYSFNIIDKMTIKNGTTLLLQHNANLLKELYSGVDSGSNVVPAVVGIDDDNKTVTKNVDNRIYMVPGQNLNVTTNPAGTAYGKVTGMTFFGMYTPYDNGTYRFGLYDQSVNYGDRGNASMEIIGGSYVKGLHHTNHDITLDGFYSNFLNDDMTEVSTAYINPSTLGERGYRWIIGFEAFSYEVNLLATKYSSLGTAELQLDDFAAGNTIFTVLGADTSGLNPEITLVDSNDVPRVAKTPEIANGVLGLSMKAETQEWTGRGTTKYLSADGGSFTGNEEYTTDSRQLVPSLMFYLYHAKNIDCDGKLGTLVITLRADIPKNQIDYDIKFITVTVTLTAMKISDVDSYDASISYDKRYEMPSSTSVNITNQSQFSTYYSLISWNDDFKKVYGNNNEYFHVLVTNYALPVNTMITMLDFCGNTNRPEYYYYRITQQDYNDSVQQLSQYNEITYRLSKFIKMDSTSTNNRYDDAVMNHVYYDEEAGLVDEEFMFIFDFKETTTTGQHLDNYMLFELRTPEDRTIYNVLGIREPLMYFNLYNSSNVVLEQTIADNEEYLYYNIADEFTYSTDIKYNETDNRESVIDTNYESSKMGLNVSILDRNGDPVSSSLLVGTSIIFDRKQYFADSDGVYRIKLADKVSNLVKNVSLTVSSDLPPEDYTIRYTLFASDDGLHNSSYENSVSSDYLVHVVNNDNSITVECDDLFKVVDGETSLNMNNTKVNQYTVKYNANLNNPNFRVEVYKRDISDIDGTSYTSVDFNNLFANRFSKAYGHGNEVYINMDSTTEKTFDFDLADNLTSGTYRISFKLYDNDQLIDEDIKYVIVKKKSDG